MARFLSVVVITTLSLLWNTVPAQTNSGVPSAASTSVPATASTLEGILTLPNAETAKVTEDYKLAILSTREYILAFVIVGFGLCVLTMEFVHFSKLGKSTPNPSISRTSPLKFIVARINESDFSGFLLVLVL